MENCYVPQYKMKKGRVVAEDFRRETLLHCVGNAWLDATVWSEKSRRKCIAAAEMSDENMEDIHERQAAWHVAWVADRLGIQFPWWNNR